MTSGSCAADTALLFVADGAHNEDAAKKLAESMEFYFTNRRISMISISLPR